MGGGGEVLVAGALGVLAEERHPAGGLDPDAATEKVTGPPGPMTGRIVSMPLGQGLTMLTELDPSRQAFLNDHRIDGTPVLPGVMGMEGFAEAARALLPELARPRARGRRPAGPVQVLPRRAAHARAAGAAARRRRRHGRGRLSADRAPRAGKRRGKGDRALHRPRPPLAGAAARPARGRQAQRGRGRRRRGRPRRRLPGVLPRPRLPGTRARLALGRRHRRAFDARTYRRPTSRQGSRPRSPRA